MNSADLVYMTQAIRLAKLGIYTTRPYPRVGCVLTKAGNVIAEGWHHYAGGPHAERVALGIAGANARGATAYVSLEPCCHYGRTPPCTDALIAAGVTRVVVAMQDPNPKVAGQGLAQLTAAGIKVDLGLMETQAKELNPGFIKRMSLGLPWVRLKLAMSLDGRTAPAHGGTGQWITGTSARRDVQFLRARSDAILTGIGTILADDPALTVRLDAMDLPGLNPDIPVMQPLRVILDSHLRTPTTAQMLNLPGQTLILFSSPTPNNITSLPNTKVKTHKIKANQNHVDFAAALQFLATMEINEVLLESGPTLAGVALESGLVDELIIYLAPHLMSDEALGLFCLPTLNGGQKRLELDIRDMRAVGQDWRITARLLNTSNCLVALE